MTDSMNRMQLAAEWGDFIDAELEDVIAEAIGDVVVGGVNGDYVDDAPVVVSYEALEEFSGELGVDLQFLPRDSLHAAADAIVRHDASDDEIEVDDVTVRIEGLPQTELREVTHNHLGNLVAVPGVVQKATDPQPRFTEIAYECMRCGAISTIPQTEEGVQEPYQCESCERQGPFRADTVQSSFVQYQQLRVQESPEGLRGGEDPRSIDIHVEGDLVDSVSPGDSVTAIGEIVHETPESSSDTSAVDLYMRANNLISRSESSSVKDLDDEVIDEIEEMVEEFDDPMEAVVESIAPSIYGYEDIKTAVAFQMFSGVRKFLPDKTVRGDIHVMLVGDPGTAKSQVLEFVSETMPRGTYSTGEGASKAGMTAAAVQSDFGDGWSVEAGALVMSDNGIASVDELDKLPSDGLNAFHTALEQQKVYINKAGINTTLNARCGVLGAANPEHGRWDEYEPIPQQIDLPPAVISRFDLVFTVQDKPDEEFDSALATSILDNSQLGQLNARRVKDADGLAEDVEHDQQEDPPIPMDMLPAYITYARDEVMPELSEGAKEVVHDFYVDMRSKGEGEDSAIPVTARKLEALIRLAEASARIRLSEEIEEVDAQRAIQIVQKSLEDVGIDPETGEPDADIMETGKSKTQRDRIKSVESLIKELEPEYQEDGVPLEVLYEKAEEHGFDQSKVEHAVEGMKQAGEVYEPSNKHIRTT